MLHGSICSVEGSLEFLSIVIHCFIRSLFPFVELAGLYRLYLNWRESSAQCLHEVTVCRPLSWCTGSIVPYSCPSETGSHIDQLSLFIPPTCVCDQLESLQPLAEVFLQVRLFPQKVWQRWELLRQQSHGQSDQRGCCLGWRWLYSSQCPETQWHTSFAELLVCTGPVRGLGGCDPEETWGLWPQCSRFSSGRLVGRRAA